MVFTINNNLVFIESMQFMNSSLDRLVKNLTDNDFKYLSQEFTDLPLEKCPVDHHLELFSPLVLA